MNIKVRFRHANLIIPAMVAFFNVLIILYPADILQAAREGLGLWFDNVMPSLLPFLIGTNILTGLGFVSFAGTLLEPVMQPLFGVPGCGGYALVTGMTSGYPVGAKTAGLLRETGALSRNEAQRLLAFCNNSGPLFILGAVGTGMLNSPAAGYYIMVCHYTGAILTGLLFKYYRRDRYAPGTAHRRQLRQAVQGMRAARQKDGRPFGAIMGDSVKNAMETIAVVGGFIVLFCVIVRILEVTGTLHAARNLLTPFVPEGTDPRLLDGLLAGIIEVTNGAKLLSTAETSMAQIFITVGIISFGGLSIHAQTLSFISRTDISPSVYMASKLLHAVLSVAVAAALSPFFTLGGARGHVVPAFFEQPGPMHEKLVYSCALFALSVVFIAALILIMSMARLFSRRGKRI